MELKFDECFLLFWRVITMTTILATARGLSAGRAAAAGGWRRWNSGSSARAEQNQRVLLYLASIGVGAVGMSYAAVPLYKAFCQRYGFGGDTGKAVDPEQAAKMRPVKDGRQLKITFNADTSDMMPWKFRPTTREVRVVPGETALAFYKASNPTDKTVTGVSTYNITPYKAGVYFNKIQCFCFEEQRLKAREEVDMPVFFYIDPAFMEDPQMTDVTHVTLSYTFFKTDGWEDEEDELAVAPAKKMQPQQPTAITA